VTAPAVTAIETAWKRRYRAARLSFPVWARDNADRLVYTSNASGKYEIYAWDRSRDEHRQVTDRPAGTGFMVPPRLDPRGERIYWFDDAKGNELGHFRVEPFAKGDSAPILADLAPAYSARIAVAAAYVVVGRSRSDEGTTMYLVAEGAPPRQLYAHPQSASVNAISRDESLIAISHSEHGDSRNRAVRVLDLGGRVVADLWDGPGRGLDPIAWSPVVGDQRLLVTHERRGVERPLILHAADGRAEEIEIELPGEVTADWYPDASSLLIKHDHRGRGELYWFDLKTRALERLATEAGSVSDARVRPDGEVWYMWQSAAEPPVIRGRSGVVARAPGEAAPRGTPYQDLDVGGIHVFVAEPQGRRPHPTIFMVHGGPEAHDRDEFSPRTQAWIDHGFAVVLVNYRGSSGYGKAWRDAIVGRPGLTELEDLAKVHDKVVSLGISDPKRTILSGGSWGGYLTLLGLGVQPERWSLGIGIVPIGDYVAAFEDEMEPLKRYDADLFGGTPETVPDSYQRSNPIVYADRVRVPMFLLVGQNDPRCPSRSVDIYSARLLELGKKFEEYRYDAGHGSLVVDEQIRQMEMQIAFAARHLGTQEPIAQP
jgi:acetyl esterase/lipase